MIVEEKERQSMGNPSMYEMQEQIDYLKHNVANLKTAMVTLTEAMNIMQDMITTMREQNER